MITLEELDITALKKAIESLEKAVKQLEIVPGDEFVRDACIQRFEYTYEVCGKFLRRYLEMSESNSETIKEMPFPDLIRTASERGLLQSDWPVWKTYRELRNITSHTYNETKAKIVAAGASTFLQDAQYLLKQLQNRIQS